MRLPPIVTTFIFCTGVLLAGCAPRPAASSPVKLVEFPGTPTAQCAWQEILPKITEVQPEKIAVGSEMTVIASGGYLQDSCGGYNESARTYQIYVDDEPMADLQCYVHHCQGTFTLPENITVGEHCMGVQKGTCQTKFEVVGG